MAARTDLPKMEILLIFPLSFPLLSQSRNFVGSKAGRMKKASRAGRKLFPAASAIVDPHMSLDKAGTASWGRSLTLLGSSNSALSVGAVFRFVLIVHALAKTTPKQRNSRRNTETSSPK